MEPTIPLPNPLPEGEGVEQVTNCLVRRSVLMKTLTN